MPSMGVISLSTIVNGHADPRHDGMAGIVGGVQGESSG
jgi:hypothetical protein